MDNKLSAELISILHFLLFCFLIYAPFAKDKRYTAMFLLIVPFLFWHWSINDDTCALTEIEYRLRNIEKKESFFHKLISPVYKMEESQVNKLGKSLMLLLLYISIYRLDIFELERNGIIFRLKLKV